ncbi:MAG: flippase [Candidatus Melainabacteria bacterium]|nr:flippase [Candidatus Melainabacteria bacterium]
MRKKQSLSKKLFFGIIYLFSSSIITIGIKVVTIAYIARRLGVEQFGLYSALIAFIGLFQFISDFGLNKTLLKYGSKNLHQASISFGNALFAKSILILPLLICVGISGYFAGYNNDTYLSLMLFATSMIFDSYAHVFSSIRRITGSFKLISFFRIVKTLVTLAVYVYVLYVYNSVFVLALATLLLTMFMFVVSLINTVMLLKPRLKLSILKDFFQDSILFSLNDLFINIYARIGIVILSFFNELFVVGVYSAALRFTKIAILLPRQIRFAMLPTMYRLLDDKSSIEEKIEPIDPEVDDVAISSEALIEGDLKKSKKVFNLMLKYMSFFSTPVAILIFYFSESIIHLIFGSKYDSSIPFVQLFTVFIFFRFIETPFGLYYLGLNRHKDLIILQGIASAINILLCFLLIPSLAGFGAAMSTNISEIIFVVLVLFFGIQFKIWDVVGSLSRICLPFIVGLVSLFITVKTCGSVNIIVQLFVFALSYLCLLIVSRQFGKEDTRFFKKVFLKK